jgi:hypothetical protein
MNETIRGLKKKTTIDVVECIKAIFPGIKNKYIPLVYGIIKERCNNEREINTSNLRCNGISHNLESISDINIMLISSIHDTFQQSDVNTLLDFIRLTEKKMISIPNLSEHTSMKIIYEEVEKIKLRDLINEMKTGVEKIFENEKWIIIKPLTFASSLKYGGNTKWCVSMRAQPSYFYRYIRDGILIFFINKESGQKIASYTSLSPEDNLSTDIWNESDLRIGLLTIPIELIEFLRHHIPANLVTNMSMLTATQVKNELTFLREIYPTDYVELCYYFIDICAKFGIENDEKGGQIFPKPDNMGDMRPLDPLDPLPTLTNHG